MDAKKQVKLYLTIMFLFIAGIIYNILINRRVSKFKDDDSQKTLIIENDYVELLSGSQKARLEMSEIQYVIINNYSICFLPKNVGSTLIAVNKSYKDSVINAIVNKDIIVDNSSLYQ